ncbi:MAG: 16S rRNA (cytidine(1402)-2'-O)-methyltransferase, partial [Clostridia bacterium]|nr:16S rRNA (cytidine(1402)-2'-O)-methyltransferase [Clostridia bacterium]
YEAPHKLKNTISDMQKIFGGDRKIALARELTKVHEEVIRLTLDEAAAYYEINNPRGEYVIVVDGAKETENEAENQWENVSVKEHVDRFIAEGMTQKDAIKKAAEARGVPKREVYNEYHKED